MSAPPQWAQETVNKFCIDRELKLPNIRWVRRKKTASSTGNTKHWINEIFIAAGSYELNNGKARIDQKLVLLHELVHWSFEYGEGHSPAFWDRAWEVYREYKLPMRYALFQEGMYKKEATKAYRRNLLRRKTK